MEKIQIKTPIKNCKKIHISCGGKINKKIVKHFGTSLKCNFYNTFSLELQVCWGIIKFKILNFEL